jgi:hypothetical protein
VVGGEYHVARWHGGYPQIGRRRPVSALGWHIMPIDATTRLPLTFPSVSGGLAISRESYPAALVSAAPGTRRA